MILCWEPCGLVLDQYMSACPVGSRWGKSPWGQSHLARTVGFWTVDFWTVQKTAGTIRPARSLLSCNIDDSLGGFSVILSIMQGRNVIIPGNPNFSSRISSPKILWELMLLRFLVWGCQLSLQTLGAVLAQCWQDQGQITPICKDRMYLAWQLAKLRKW